MEFLFICFGVLLNSHSNALTALINQALDDLLRGKGLIEDFLKGLF